MSKSVIALKGPCMLVGSEEADATGEHACASAPDNFASSGDNCKKPDEDGTKSKDGPPVDGSNKFVS